MGFLYLLISILGESIGKTIDKLNFRRNRITARLEMFLIFVAMSLSLSVYVVLTHQSLPRFAFISLGLVSLIGLVSFGSNVFDTLSLKSDDLSLREPLVDFEPIAAGLVGYALFPGERRPGFLLAFVLGAVIVYYGTHRRKLRRLQKRGMSYLLLVVALEALLPSIYKEALIYLSPAYIALFRTTSIIILAILFFPPKSRSWTSPGKLSYSFMAGIVYATATVASLYAIKELGVVLTMLLTLLGPFLRYLSGYFILKEKVRTGEMVSSALLALVVLVPIVR